MGPGTFLLLKNAPWTQTCELVVSRTKVKVLYNGLFHAETGTTHDRHHRESELYFQVDPEEWL